MIADAHIGSHGYTWAVSMFFIRRFWLGVSVRAESTPADYGFVRRHLEHATLDWTTFPSVKQPYSGQFTCFQLCQSEAQKRTSWQIVVRRRSSLVVASCFAMYIPATLL